jgi:hypothetical protein
MPSGVAGVQWFGCEFMRVSRIIVALKEWRVRSSEQEKLRDQLICAVPPNLVSLPTSDG